VSAGRNLRDRHADPSTLGADRPVDRVTQRHGREARGGGVSAYAWRSTADFKGNPLWGGLDFAAHPGTGDSSYLYADGHSKTAPEDPAANQSLDVRDEQHYAERWNPLP